MYVHVTTTATFVPLRNIHPATFMLLPPPIGERDGGLEPQAGLSRTARLPTATRPTCATSGSTGASAVALVPSAASIRMQALCERIRAKEAAATTTGASSTAKRRLWSKTKVAAGPVASE